MKKNNFFLFTGIMLIAFCLFPAGNGRVLDGYTRVLHERGKPPIEFVLEKMDTCDLILFDDALHTAVEPFEFYRSLLSDSRFREKVKYIFLEVVSVNQQPALDAYLNSDIEDLSLLYPAFQNDFSGTGWPYKTYLDLFQAIRKINDALPVRDRYFVLAVNAPTYWSEIRTPKDLELFRLSLAGNDYTMYKIMLSYLDGFKSGKKGIFLTNTRHAYKGIKDRHNRFYWNCGTFFTRLNPGKTCSVRFHNISFMFQEKEKISSRSPKTTEGLEDVVIRWVRMENGLWDSAFESYGNTPVAFDLKDTPFGAAGYIGNHMLNAAPGQTMQDAYDALIFLGAVETLRQTAILDDIYTETFRNEMERRIRILYKPEQLDKMLIENDAKSIKDFISKVFAPRDERINPLVKLIGDRYAWKTKKR